VPYATNNVAKVAFLEPMSLPWKNMAQFIKERRPIGNIIDSKMTIGLL
jgi:hypothetical protein